MKRRNKKKREFAVPTASMGDIAFLLIIFFMVCSKFSQDVAIKLKPPKSPGLLELSAATVTISIDDEGQVWIQDKQISGEEAVEWGVRGLIKDKQGAKGRTVMFRCHKEIGKEVFEPVLEAIAKGGGLIAATGEKGSREE
jgi:biopolymer transport protein ExbD